MRNQGVGSWPARRARMTPQRSAIVHETTVRTYAELADRVTRLAHTLRGLGVGRGDRVAYLGRNHPALAETLFATGLLGAVFVALNARLAVAELAYNLDDSGAATMLWAADFADTVAVLRQTAKVREYLAVGAEYEQRLAAADASALDEPVGFDDVCMIQYTSGTTGHPKGVMLSHGNIAWNCYNI